MRVVKQVIAVRRDLKMRRGKEAAQVAHAAMEWLRELITDCGERVTPVRMDNWACASLVSLLDRCETDWLIGDHAKIVVQVADEAELMALDAAATSAGLTSCVVTDIGATEFHGVPTKTCVAIGPDQADKIDAVCGHLKLY